MRHFNVIKSTYLFLFSLLITTLSSCAQNKKHHSDKADPIVTGADQTFLYLPLLEGKNVAIVANQTSLLANSNKETIHLVDFLHQNNKIKVAKVFAPEHGFRGKADAGEKIVDGVDSKTGLPIISLYGKNKKPSNNQLKTVDIVVFDIQDVGVRFYTYVSTLHYVMEACAEKSIPVILLDRPNPNAHYVDGPVLDMKHKSFVGMHPVPVVYGMTIGEYGKMINGEKWLNNKAVCDLTVIPLKNYTHKTSFDLPVKPSPNLPNSKSINLYPSLCFFEGTTVSAGRGTNMQFQIFGSPYQQKGNFSFVPQPNEGAKYPKHEGKNCIGEDLRDSPWLDRIDLKWLINAYQNNTKEPFFNSFFTKLAGTEELQEQIENGISLEEIRKSWTAQLNDFGKIRKKYLLYP